MGNLLQPAIVVIAYNRANSLSRLLNSIQQAYYPHNNITLVISIDYSSSQEEILKIANNFKWNYGEKVIRPLNNNYGLKKHVLSCGDLTQKYGAVIILEDDLYVSPDYYNYAEAALNWYNYENRIGGIALYSHSWNAYAGYPFIPVRKNYTNYFGQFSITWGQAWTYNQWKKFRVWLRTNESFYFESNELPEAVKKWGEKSWGKFFFKFLVDTGSFYVMPYVARSTNFSDSGVHAAHSSIHQVPIFDDVSNDFRFAPFDEESIKYDSFFERVFNKDICNINPKEICIDLNGVKNISEKDSYLLTCKKLCYPVIGTFGLETRPIDYNVDLEITGNGIYLYDIRNIVVHSKKREKYCRKGARLNYEIAGYWWLDLMPYVINGVFKQIKVSVLKRLMRLYKWILGVK